jgi:hypothetical protein
MSAPGFPAEGSPLDNRGAAAHAVDSHARVGFPADPLDALQDDRGVVTCPALEPVDNPAPADSPADPLDALQDKLAADNSAQHRAGNRALVDYPAVGDPPDDPHPGLAVDDPPHAPVVHPVVVALRDGKPAAVDKLAAVGHPAHLLHHRALAQHPGNQALALHGLAVLAPGLAVDDHHPDPADDHRPGLAVDDHRHENHAARLPHQKAEANQKPRNPNRSCPWIPSWTFWVLA